MNYEKLPKELKNLDVFCLWKYQKDKSGRLTKPPFSAKTGGYASVNKPSDFVSFNEAYKKLENYDGLGIRLTYPILGIDIDHCIKDGVLIDFAKEIVSKFPTSYIEYSPSKEGLHIYLKYYGEFDKEKYKFKTENVEVYLDKETNRYLTVTGEVFQDGDIVENDDSLYWLLETFMKRESRPQEKALKIESMSYLADNEVIEKASSASNKDKFLALWNGNLKGYSSQSEADLALVSILAFYCGKDEKQMDRLFRKSKLYRNKWDENRGHDTYGNLTIKKAISSVNETYKPFNISSAFENFNDELIRLKEMGCPNKYKWDDIGSSLLFADFYKDILRYVPERKSWIIYKDGYWQKDTGSIYAMKLCMKLAELLKMCVSEVKEENKWQDFIKYAKRWNSHNNRVTILKDAQVHHPVKFSDFDKDPFLFNLKNGTYDIRNNIFRNHNSTDLITKISPVNFDKNARCDRWNEFISEIMNGDKDREKFLQKLFGYALSGGNHLEIMMILYGATTRNGKGTLCESILKVFGTYGITSRPETISLQNQSSTGPSEDLARLVGIRYVNISEPKKGLVLNAALLKSMTGNDTINARFLHENSFDFSPQFKLFINTNYLPVITDMTVFSSGRLIIVPFDRHFSENEQDKSLKSEFKKDNSQSAILNWLIEGKNLIEKEGLKIPDSVKVATESYKKESDKINLFIEDCLIEDKNSEVRSQEVYESYRTWCYQNGHYVENMKNFKQAISLICEIKRKKPKSGGNKTTMIVGFSIKDDLLT